MTGHLFVSRADRALFWAGVVLAAAGAGVALWSFPAGLALALGSCGAAAVRLVGRRSLNAPVVSTVTVRRRS